MRQLPSVGDAVDEVTVIFIVAMGAWLVMLYLIARAVAARGRRF